MILQKYLFFIFTISVILTGCGGGGSSESPDNPLYSAYLSDSRVSGVGYKCASLNGVTDSQGKFDYSSECSRVDFFIGSISIGSIERSKIVNDSSIYPSDFLTLDRNDTKDLKLVKILQLIQSLDNDNNPYNGIVIDKNVSDALQSVSLNLDDNATTTDDLNQTLQSVGKTLIKAEYAIAHYEDTLRNEANISVRTVAPAPAILATANTLTNQNSVQIIVNGAIGAKVYVDGVDTNVTIDTNNSATLTLDTSGDDGEKDFNVTLSDVEDNQSAPLTVMLLKDTVKPVMSLTDREVNENTPFVLDVNASDENGVLFSISGSDADSFDINETTGVLTLKKTADYEAKNFYEVQVRATDRASNTQEKTFRLNILPLNDVAPVLGEVASKNVDENFVGTLLTLTSTDGDLNQTQTFTYSLSGVDASYFNIDPTSGVVTFKSSPDYETRQTPYIFSVKVNDGVFDSQEQNVTIGINPINDVAPVLGEVASKNVDENFVGTLLTLTSTDGDLNQTQTFTYSLSGVDASYFNIDPTSGVVTFKSSPDYETRQTPYSIGLSVSDGVNTSTVKNITIGINHLNDEAPVITNVVVEKDIDENTPISTVIIAATSSDSDIDETQSISYILGGVDAANFNIDASSGDITFKTVPDYENPKDADRNNQYQLTIRANDGVNEGPVSNLLVRLNNLDDVPTPLAYDGVVRGSVNYGYMVANALIVLQDKNKNLISVYSDAYGNYSFNLGSNFVGPFILKAYLPTGEILYSYNDGEHEVTNITPVTSLMVADFIVDLGLSDTLEEFFNSFSDHYTTYITVFKSTFSAVYTKISAYFSSYLGLNKLTGFNHLYNIFYGYGFDYDVLLSSLSMSVEAGEIIIRDGDTIYASDTSMDYSGDIDVKGLVVNASGAAVANASVSVFYGGTTINVTTDATGYYTISLPKYIKYNLVISYDNMSINYYNLSTFLDESNSEATELTVSQAQFVDAGSSTISGKVVNVNNSSVAVPNATVKVREGYNNQTGTILKTITTNENGEFSQELENGNYTFEFSKESWTTKYKSVYVNSTKAISDTEIGLVTDVFGISLVGVDLLESSDSGISSSDNITNDTTPTLFIDQEANLLVKNAAFTTVQEINVTTAQNVTLNTLSDGEYTVVGVDSSGNATGFTLLAFTIDTTTVLKPTINLHSSTDSGVSDSDNITKSNPVQLRGTAEVNSTIVLKDNNTTLANITVDANGDYVQNVYSSAYNYYNNLNYYLDEGEHNLTVTATDIAGNVQVSDVLELVIDRTGAPLTNIDLNASSDTGRSSTDNYTSDATPTFVTDQNVTLDVRDSSGTIIETLFSGYLNNYTVTLSTLSDGVYKITSGDENNNSDTAGNVLNYSYTNFTIDTTVAPVTLDMYYYDDKGVSNSDNITNDNTPRITAIGESNSYVTIFNGTTELGSGYLYYLISLDELMDGNYTLTATIVDLAGNESNESSPLEIEIDTVGVTPSTIDLNTSSDTGYSQTDNITNDNTPTIITSLETTLRVMSGTTQVQELNTTALGDGTYSATLSTLADGTYTIESGVSGTDTAGNTLGYSSLNITIDTNVSIPTIDLDVASDSGVSDSDNITNDNTPTINGSVDNYTKVVISDGVTILETLNSGYSYYYNNGSNDTYYSGAYSFLLSELSDGNHTIGVTVYDVAGNEATATLEIEIDTIGVPSIEMDIVGSEIDTLAIIDGISAKLNALPNQHPLTYSDLYPTYWGDAGDNMYDNGNYLYIDGELQELWETTNSTDRNSTNFGNYTFRTNQSSTVLFVENFQGSEFKIDGRLGYYSNIVSGELESVNGLHVYYKQASSSYYSYASTTQIVVTNAKEPLFSATTSTSSDYDSFTLSNIQEGSNLIYILIAGKDGYTYSKEELQEIVNNLEVVANATNDATPTILTDANATITIKDDANATLQTITTTLTDGNYSATLATLSDGRYVAQIGSKGTDTAGNLLSYTAMPFVVDTVITSPTLDLNTSSDSGISDSDNITNMSSIVLSGTAEARTKIEIKDASEALLALGYSNSDGEYSISVNDLVDANHTLTSISTDAAGNSKTETLNVVVDTFGDTLIEIYMDSDSDTGISSSDQITGNTTPTMLTDRETTLTILDESNSTVQTVATSSLSATLASLSDGTYVVEGGDRGTDIAGNPLSYNTTTIQIDTTPPSLVSPNELDENSTITSSSLHVYNTATSDDSQVTYTLGGDDAAYFTIDEVTGVITLSDIANSGARYTLEVTATDVVGNTQTYSVYVTPQVVTPLATAKVNIANASAVASFGNYTVVGLASENSSTGAVYVYEKQVNGLLKELTKLTASDASSYDNFGYSVSIDADTIVIGSYGDDDVGGASGSAYVFKKDSNGSFTQVAKLTASDGTSSDYFGYSVAVDGEAIVVGAYGDDDNGSTSGSAYVFKIDSNETVTEVAKLISSDASSYDYFGYSVAISGENIIVGAYQKDGAYSDEGGAYIFKLNVDNSVTEVAKLTVSDATNYDYFGESVSVSGDYAVVGTSYKNSNRGAAYVYKIDSNKVEEIAKLTVSDSYYSEYFAKSVSIDGNYIVVSSQDYANSSRGAAYLYKIDNEDSVTQMSKLIAPDATSSNYFAKLVAVSGNNLSLVSNTGVYSYDIFADRPYVPSMSTNISVTESLGTTIYTVPFSTNVDASEISYSLSGVDADKFTIADKTLRSNSVLDFESPTDADLDNSYMLTLTLEDLSGRVNAYDLNISVVDEVYFEDAKLKANDADYSDYLGNGVAIEGNYVITGASQEDANGEYNAGSAYLFARGLDGTMTQVSKLSASDGSSYDYFGSSVAISGEYVVVGAESADGVVGSSGAAYLFKINSDNTTTQLAKLSADDGASGDDFGFSVAMSGDYIVVGAHSDDDLGTTSGSVYVFKKDVNDNVSQIAKLTGSNSDSYDSFGYAVAIDDSFIAIGAYGRNSDAYLFEIVADDNITEVSKFTTVDSKSNFGYDIDIDGDYIVVSNYGYDNAYLFKKDISNSVAQVAKLETTNTSYFGRSVAISGDTIVVGDSGVRSATVFAKDGADSVTEISKVSSASGTYDNYGFFVDIDGTNIAIGANEDDTTYSNSGAVYIYTKDSNQP